MDYIYAFRHSLKHKGTLGNRLPKQTDNSMHAVILTLESMQDKWGFFLNIYVCCPNIFYVNFYGFVQCIVYFDMFICTCLFPSLYPCFAPLSVPSLG